MMRKEVRVREFIDGSKGLVEMQLPNIKKYGSTCWQVEQPRRGGTFLTPETRFTPLDDDDICFNGATEGGC
jgi:hypothetical protein